MNSKSSNPEQHNQLVSLLAIFETEFPSDQACLDELLRLAQIEKKCRLCRNDLEMHFDGRVGKCTACKKDTWLTAGTFLDHMRLPKVRLAAIWLTRQGAVLNSLVFAKLLSIAQSSAYDILQWLRFALQNCLPDDAHLVHSSIFANVFRKRSRETPAREPPIAEQDEIEKLNAASASPAINRESQDVSKNSKERHLSIVAENILSSHGQSADEAYKQAEEIYSLLSDLPHHFEELLVQAKIPVGKLSAVLTVWEIEGALVRLAGDRYVQRKRKPKPRIDLPNPDVSRAIADFHSFIQLNFKGISRRYLQGYLAYWYHINRIWSDETAWQAVPLSWLAACHEICNYVSPLYVKLIPP